MALFGTQLVITMVMASVLQKLGPYYSLGRWLLCSTGLIRYLYPTDEELRNLAGVPKDKGKGKKGRNENGKTTSDTFHVPRSLDVQLETAKVSALDVIHLRYYSEYQWLVDFTLYSIVVYILTESYYALFTVRDEVNLSMLWCAMVLGFSLKILLTLTVQYFRGEESVGERSMCIVMAFAYFVFSMMVLIVDENTLELGLENAYSSFNESAAALLEIQGLDSKGPASKLILKFCLALWCGLVGAVFTFPGFRMAKMHWDSLRYCEGKRVMRLLLNISFATPFLLVLLWIRPLSRDYFTRRIFTGMIAPLMKEDTFDTLRLVAVIAAVLLRISLMPIYLQAYLDMAHHRVEEQKKEVGRITNLDLQKKIAAVFYYLCVVTLQYVAPIVMCLFLALMYKTLGGYSWSSFFTTPVIEKCPSTEPVTLSQLLPEDDSIALSAEHFTLALSTLKQVFTTEVYRGLLGFATWWCCFTWFASSSLGMVYQSYFSQS